MLRSVVYNVVRHRAAQLRKRIGELGTQSLAISIVEIKHRHFLEAGIEHDLGHGNALQCVRRRRSEPVDPRLSFLGRSEEHTSELQSLMRISYAVFCL